MALQPVKRISIIAHKNRRSEILEEISRLGTVHLSRPGPDEEVTCDEVPEKINQDIRDYSYKLSQVEFLLGFLYEHKPEKSGFVKTMIKDKHYMTLEEFMEAAGAVDLDRIYDRCTELEKRLISLRDERARLEEELEELQNWIDLDTPLDQIKGDPMVGMLPMRIRPSDVERLSEALAEEAPLSSLEVASEKEGWSNCVILYHPEAEENVNDILSGFHFEVVALPESPLEPDEYHEQVERGLGVAKARHEEAEKEVVKYTVNLPGLEVVKEYVINQKRKLEQTANFGNTRRTVLIQGWVTESGAERTTKSLQGLSDDIYVEVSDPEPDSRPPVSLKNRKHVRPFEVLTRLYGMPNNREFDPTWLIAISFVIFFGFCIGDVGYGLVLIVAFSLFKRYLPIGQNVKDLLTVMVWGGLASMVVGVLTGSYFGINPESLPAFMQSAAVFDSLNEPIPVMGVCMGLGLVHMLAGTVVEFKDNWKLGRKADALIDQGLILLLFVGSGVAIVLVFAGIVPVAVALAIPVAALLGMVVLFGHHSRSVPGKMFGGLYETYNTLVGWLGDTVSYVRLFALGLATFAVGWVINILGGMAFNIAPVIGILLMVVILVVGHTFNVTVNLLGAFVHPLRLEFVEFFSKFYEDGGTDFRPLKVESKTVIIE